MKLKLTANFARQRGACQTKPRASYWGLALKCVFTCTFHFRLAYLMSLVCLLCLREAARPEMKSPESEATEISSVALLVGLNQPKSGLNETHTLLNDCPPFGAYFASAPSS